MCSFPVKCFGQDVEIDCIGSRSMAFHLLWIADIIYTTPFVVYFPFTLFGTVRNGRSMTLTPVKYFDAG